MLSLAASFVDWSAAAERITSKNNKAAEGSPEAAQSVRKALEAEAAGATDEGNSLPEASQLGRRSRLRRRPLAVGRSPRRQSVAGDRRGCVGELLVRQICHLPEVARRGRTDGQRCQSKVARWCQEAGLKEQERLHLANVLQLRPTNNQQRDVAEKLGLVRYRKILMPAATAEALKRQAKESEAALQKWKPVLTRLRGDLESRDKARQEAAAQQLEAVHDVTAAIPALETVFAKSTADAGQAAIAALAAMPQQEATDSLVRHAHPGPTRRSAPGGGRGCSRAARSPSSPTFRFCSQA